MIQILCSKNNLIILQNLIRILSNMLYITVAQLTCAAHLSVASWYLGINAFYLLDLFEECLKIAI